MSRNLTRIKKLEGHSLRLQDPRTMTDEELTRAIFGADTAAFRRARQAELASDHETFDRLAVTALLNDAVARGKSIDDASAEIVGIGFAPAYVREIASAHTAEEHVH